MRIMRKNCLKSLLVLLILLVFNFALMLSVNAEIGDSGVILPNGEEVVVELPNGVKLHEQDIKALKDCAGNYYYEYDSQYLESAPNAEGIKIATWSFRNADSWKMAGVSDIAKNFEKENPGWIVLGGTNADFFNINGNGAMSGNAMEMGELIHPEHEDLDITWRGILGFTKDNELITGAPDMTPYYNIHVYENNDMKEELDSIKIDAVNPSKVSESGITLLTKDINQRWDLTGCKVIVGRYDICRYDDEYTGKHYYLKGTLVNTRDGLESERPTTTKEIDGKIESVNEFYLVSKDGSLDSLEMNTYVKIQRDYINEYAEIYNSATYYWKILDQGKVLFEGHSNSAKKKEFESQYPGCDLSYVYATKSRCLFGVREDGSYVMAVVGGTSTSGMTLSEAAYYMKEIGCIDAWDFDGGGSATLVARDSIGQMQTINVPSDAGDGTERRVGNAIFMIARDPGFNSYKKYSTLSSVTFDKKTDLDYYSKMENIKITLNGVTKEVAKDAASVTFENLVPGTVYDAVINYTVDGEECVATMKAETKAFNPYYTVQSNTYGFTVYREEDNDTIKIVSTTVYVDDVAYNMGSALEYKIEELTKDCEYEIYYKYTAEVIATGEQFYYTSPVSKYTTLAYELPYIVEFSENKKMETKLRVKYKYEDPDGLVSRAFLLLNGKQTMLEDDSGTHTFEQLDFVLNSYYVQLVVCYIVDDIEFQISSSELIYEKLPCVHEYDNACDDKCNICNESRTIEHKWVDATYTSPKKCTVCGLTEGSPLVCNHQYDNDCDTICNVCESIREVNHKYEKATCDKPKTCSVCGATEGSANGHDFDDATYTSPKTCKVCGKTEGEPLKCNHKYDNNCDEKCNECGAERNANHSWKEATKKAPKTCSVCGATEGEPLKKGCKKTSLATILISINLFVGALLILKRKNN